MPVSACSAATRRRPGKTAALAAAGVLLGAAVTWAAQVRAEPMSATYEVYFGGFHVLNAAALWQRSPGSYRITAEAETQGMIGWLYPWKGTTESRGRVESGLIVPQQHDNHGVSERGERLVSLRYDPSGDIAEAVVEPEQDWEDRHPLPADAGKGTLDPLSVVAGLSEILQHNGRCEGEFSVFDGRRRYDLTVSDAGTTELEPTDYSIYAGEARGCAIDYTLLGGHRLERNKYAATARKRIIWVASPAEDAPVIPVRLQIETAYGTVMGHITGFSQGPQAEARLAK